MPRIALITAALLGGFLSVGAAGCGTRTPTIGGQVRISALFPYEKLPLVGVRLLEVLPAETLGVAIAPSLDQVVEQLLGSQGIDARPEARPAMRPEVRAALGAVAEDRLGYDVFDIAAMRAMGVATDAPVAVAILDAEIGALVLPLRDRKLFDRSWREGPETYRASHARHAVVAFPLGGAFDATSDIIRGLRVVARGLSMASHAGLRTAARRLRHGDDLLLLINPESLHRAGIAHLDEARTYYDLQTSREMVELSDPNDGESYREARADLLVAERAVERLDTWQALLDGSMAALSGIAVGVGLDGAGVKVQAAAVLAESALADRAAVARATAPLPPALSGRVARGGRAAARVPARLIVPLVGMAAGARVQQKLDDVVAALGGHTALTGAMAAELHTRGSLDRADEKTALGALVIRLGVRNADQVTRTLRGQRKLPGWTMRVDGSALVLAQSGTGRRGGGMRADRRTHRDQAGRTRTLARALARASALAHSAIDGRTLVAALTRALTSRAGEDLSEQLSATASHEQRVKHSRLADSRRRLIRDHRQRLGALRTALASWLGVAAVAVQRDGKTVYLHGLQGPSEPADPGGRLATGARIAEVWYEHSQYSPYGKKLAELDSHLARIHATLDMNSLNELLEDGQEVDLLAGSGISASQLSPAGGPPIIAGRGVRRVAVSGSIGSLIGNGASPFEPLVTPPSVTLVTTASVTRSDSVIERAALDRTLLTVLPGLRRCYRTLWNSSKRATGYLRAELTVRAGAIAAIAVSPTQAGSPVAAPEFLTCVRTALDRVLVGAVVGAGSTATATLWFGLQPPMKDRP